MHETLCEGKIKYTFQVEERLEGVISGRGIRLRDNGLKEYWERQLKMGVHLQDDVETLQLKISEI